jgi:hypothetical protein
MLEDDDLDLIPDHLREWKDTEIVYKPGEVIDDGKVCISYRTKEGHLIPCAARSELMVVTGPQKSRKSLLQHCIVANNWTTDHNYTFGYETDFGPDPVVVFDTEQPKRRGSLNVARFHDMLSLNQPAANYRMFNLKKHTVNQKLEMITHIIDQVMQDHGDPPGMIIIDQVADLCQGRDVNNAASVAVIYDHINLWQEMTKNNTLLSTTIHTNRGRMNTNGALGVMLDQKTDCTFHVDIDFESWESEVTHKEARDKRIPKFKFRQDFNGMPRLLSVEDFEYIV